MLPTFLGIRQLMQPPHDAEKRQKALHERWLALQSGQCFFVPSQDPIADEKKLRELGYEAGKGAPIVEMGLLRGKLGLLCYREVRRGRRRTVSPSAASSS